MSTQLTMFERIRRPETKEADKARVRREAVSPWVKVYDRDPMRASSTRSLATTILSQFGAPAQPVAIHADALTADRTLRSGHAAMFERDSVYLEPGYDPSTVGGRRILAHELAHAVQPVGEQASSSSALDSEAESVARAFVARRSPDAPSLARAADSVLHDPPAGIDAFLLDHPDEPSREGSRPLHHQRRHPDGLLT